MTTVSKNKESTGFETIYEYSSSLLSFRSAVQAKSLAVFKHLVEIKRKIDFADVAIWNDLKIGELMFILKLPTDLWSDNNKANLFELLAPKDEKVILYLKYHLDEILTRRGPSSTEMVSSPVGSELAEMQ